MLKKIINFILWLIYPDKCIFCGEIILHNCEDKYVCQRCIENLEFYDYSLENFAAVFEYKDSVKNMIHRFKFKYHPEYAARLADFMAQRIKAFDVMDYDYIVAVPMFYKKEKIRGFNQSQLLADELSLRIGIPSVKNQLVRIRATKPQMQLNSEKRAENVKNAFAVKDKGYFKNSKIILVDDIHTTGNTAKSCIDVLNKDGASKIFVFSLSKTTITEKL